MRETRYEFSEVPESYKAKKMDVTDLPPPKPMTETLETLENLDDAIVLIQINDRKPKLLYPKLEERGFSYETKETDKEVVTAIWS